MASHQADVLELSIPSTYDAMEQVAGLIEEAGVRIGISADEEVDLMISVMEAVNNAIQHGNKEDTSKQVHIRIKTRPSHLVCEIRDEGEGFDLTAVPDPIREENLLNPSGRGILMMCEFMDDVEFLMDENGHFVKMSKRFPSPTEPDRNKKP